MMELLQTNFQVVWELLLQIPMLWRFLLALSVTLFGMPWLIVRGLPWVLIKLSQTILFCIGYLVDFLLLPESLLSQYMRQKGYEPPQFLYLFGRLLGSIVDVFNLIYQTFDNVLRYALKKRWILKKGWLLALSVVFSIMWFFQPITKQASTRKPFFPLNPNIFPSNSNFSFVVQAGDGYANLRSSSSTKTTILAEIPNGTPVAILEQKRNSSNQLWYKVQVNGQTGWIFSGLIR